MSEDAGRASPSSGEKSTAAEEISLAGFLERFRDNPRILYEAFIAWYGGMNAEDPESWPFQLTWREWLHAFSAFLLETDIGMPHGSVPPRMATERPVAVALGEGPESGPAMPTTLQEESPSMGPNERRLIRTVEEMARTHARPFKVVTGEEPPDLHMVERPAVLDEGDESFPSPWPRREEDVPLPAPARVGFPRLAVAMAEHVRSMIGQSYGPPPAAGVELHPPPVEDPVDEPNEAPKKLSEPQSPGENPPRAPWARVAAREEDMDWGRQWEADEEPPSWK